jgi:hypothetical protein
MWVLILFIAIFACGLLNAASKANKSTSSVTNTPITQADQPTQPIATQELPTATPAPAWTTTHQFSGHTHGKTAFFTINKGWRLHWSCTNSTVGAGATGSVLIIAYDRAGHPVSGDSVDPTLTYGQCPIADSPSTGVSTVQKYGGTMYLDVFITGDWTIEIQEFK